MTPPTKADLIEEAKGLGLDVNDKLKNDELQKLIDDEKAKQAPADAADAPAADTGDGDPAPGTEGEGSENKPSEPEAQDEVAADAHTDALAEGEEPRGVQPDPAVFGDGEVGVNPYVPARSHQDFALSASEVVDAVIELPRDIRARLATALNESLAKTGADPTEPKGPTPLEEAQMLSINQPATDGLSIDEVADATGLDADGILAYAVRQAQVQGGTYVGDAYVVAVDEAGNKHAAVLA